MATDKLKNRLLRASQHGDLDKVKTILDIYGNDFIESANEYGRTSLMIVSASEHIEIVKLLLKKGANVNAVDKCGTTVLMYCRLHKRCDIAELLLANGANVERTDNSGCTVLHFAAMFGNPNLVKLLMKVRPSLTSVVNRYGESARVLARSKDIKELLLGIKPIEDLLKEGDYKEALQRYKITVIKKSSVKEYTRTCPICSDTAPYTTKCKHDYCLECYLNFYETKKCPCCRAPLTQTLFIYE